ncbi:CapA family protein [Mesorhizobium sp. M0018]|uniref:CapA family protein n=1 Tax=Mesorhizobium sp. M0018 TaxID=2956844 RepID=UPI003338B611
MGFNMVSRANSHTLDWGVEGVRETGRALEDNGIVHAGAGENLAQAGAAHRSRRCRINVIHHNVRAYVPCLRPRRGGAG